ncbi:uncharacterized protein LOC129760027 [Uranotaenia lowii]|uniref:uncharacterized protein LOC129760027 n=1 Tax=Uranotaenia lowii TaxID=190385 RepID=UPI0024784106|nr:uncharacterized protein LOC129760027 [Uranotaenia lowii]
MATERKKLASIVLHDMELPVEALEVFGRNQIDAKRLGEVSRDEIVDLFASSSSGSEIKWNTEEIFRRISDWRQMQGYDFITFEAVDVENCSEIQETVEPFVENCQETSIEQAQEEHETCIPQHQREQEALPDNDEPSSSFKVSFNSFSHRSPFTPEVLLDLLKKTEGGQCIIKRSTYGLLSVESRKELLCFIAKFHLDHGFRTDESILKEYLAAIFTVFPLEKSIANKYFIPRGGSKKNPGGQLYNLIVNTKQKRAKRAKLEELHQKNFAPVSNDSVEEVDVLVNDAVLWLKQYSKPWTTTLDKWNISFPKRRTKLCKSSNFLDLTAEFRHYGDEYGFQLVDIDFRLLGNGNPDAFNKWERLIPALTRYLNRQYNDELSKDLLYHLTSESSDSNVKLCSILLLLNNIFKPTKVTREFKPTVVFAQEDIIIFASTDEEVDQKIAEREISYGKFGFPPTPKLLFRGENAWTLTGTFELHFKDIVYRIDSVAGAVDAFVKFITVFGINCSPVCRLVWNFIRSYVYEIPVAEKYECIETLRRILDKA